MIYQLLLLSVVERVVLARFVQSLGNGARGACPGCLLCVIPKIISGRV